MLTPEEVYRAIRHAVDLLYAVHGRVMMGSEGERVIRSALRYLIEQEREIVESLGDGADVPF